MPFFLADDKLHSHRKVKSIPKADRMAAMGLWTIAGTWCRDQLSDGVVPDYMIAEFGGTRRQADTLVAAGMWVPHASGYEFVNWSQWQDTREKVEKKRADWSARQRRSREGKSRGSHGVTHDPVTRDDSVSHGGVTESSSHSSSHSQEVTTEVGSESHLSNARDQDQLSRSFPAHVVLIANRYTDRVGLSDRSKVCTVVETALKNGYLSTKVEDALDRLAASRHPVTPETLRIEIEGKPAFANGRASPSRHDENAAVVEQMRRMEATQNPFHQIEAR